MSHYLYEIIFSHIYVYFDKFFLTVCIIIDNVLIIVLINLNNVINLHKGLKSKQAGIFYSFSKIVLFLYLMWRETSLKPSQCTARTRPLRYAQVQFCFGLFSFFLAIKILFSFLSHPQFLSVIVDWEGEALPPRSTRQHALTKPPESQIIRLFHPISPDLGRLLTPELCSTAQQPQRCALLSRFLSLRFSSHYGHFAHSWFQISLAGGSLVRQLAPSSPESAALTWSLSSISFHSLTLVSLPLWYCWVFCDIECCYWGAILFIWPASTSLLCTFAFTYLFCSTSFFCPTTSHKKMWVFDLLKSLSMLVRCCRDFALHGSISEMLLFSVILRIIKAFSEMFVLLFFLLSDCYLHLPFYLFIYFLNFPQVIDSWYICQTYLPI